MFVLRFLWLRFCQSRTLWWAVKIKNANCLFWQWRITRKQGENKFICFRKADEVQGRCRFCKTKSHKWNLCWKLKKRTTFVVLLLVFWQCPILPGRLQPSIFGDAKLNFCVRDENRWTFALLSPEMVYLIFFRIRNIKLSYSTLTTAYLEKLKPNYLC